MKKINFFYFCFFISIIFFVGCSDDTTSPPPPSGPPSDLTRSGKFIAFTSNLNINYDIFLAQVNPSGVLEDSNLVYAANPFNLTVAYLSDDKQSNWSPNGRILVFSRTLGNVQEIYAFFFNSDGSRDTSITPNPKLLVPSGGNWDNNPSFSPNGAYLIWDRRYDNNNVPGVDTADSRDLYIGDVTGSGNNFQVSNPRAIITTNGDEYNPKWSPRISVRKVAYEYQNSPNATDHDVYVIDPLDTTNNSNFYNPNNSGYPAWAPACDRIIFESDMSQGDFWKIVSLSYPPSGQPVDIAAEPNIDLRYPTWLPNGGLIAYINYETNNGAIWVIPATGGTSVKLLPPQFDVADNLWPAW